MSINAGKLIELSLRDRAGKRDLTAITKEIGEKVGLSARQISRMRDYDGYPEDKAIEKLIAAMPELDVLDPASFFTRLLSSNRALTAKQRWLSEQNKENSILIISGWQAPLAIRDKGLSRLTLESLANGFTYNLLYPALSAYPQYQKEASEKDLLEMLEIWSNTFWKRLQTDKNNMEMDLESDEAYRLSLTADSAGLIDKGSVQKIISLDLEQLRKKGAIKICYLNSDDDIGFFSLFQSSYNLIYNLEKQYQDRKDTQRYGMFNIEGYLVPPSDTGIDENIAGSLLSKGWLYYSTEKYRQIATAYDQISDSIEYID
jgi:hypothetical protein